jgi:DNA-directed RNA polymerase specialized sigma subunit, sigma54 homolog
MMQEVADKVGIDISTVSRAVRDKYMDTPIGLKPLRMFFTRAVGGKHGQKESSNVAIMNRIREIIDAEDKKKPLKDDEIQARLAQEGIDIKRRTVAKYRANLGFPNHSQRREY